MAKRTWSEMDARATEKVKTFLYEVDIIRPNGNLFGYEEVAISPSAAYHARLSKLYDPSKYAWEVKELDSRYGANVIVTKKSGIRRTKHYYFIEVMPKAAYDTRMNARAQQQSRVVRYNSY